MIKRVQIKQHTPKWLKWRDEHGYGASEIAGVMAEYNSDLAEFIYTDPIQIHLLKIGESVTRFSGNINSNSGHFMEPHIIEMYRYWDNDNPDQMVMYENMRKGRKMNNIRRSSFFMTNDKYEWLFFSPDALEYRDSDIIGEKIIMKPVGIIECKNTTSAESNRYPNRVSPSFIAQVCHGLMISELEYAKILIYVDGYKLDVITLYADDPMVKAIQKNIIECSLQSWRRVLECRKIKLEHGIDFYYQYNVDIMTAKQQEGASMLQAMEPYLTGSEKEWEWIRENVYHTSEVTKMEVTNEQWQLLMDRKPAKDEVKRLEQQARKIDEQLIHSLKGAHLAVIDKDTLEEKTAFSYKKDRNDEASIYVNPKIYQE